MKKQWFTSVLLTVLLSASGATYALAHDGNGKDGQGKQCHHLQLSDEKKKLLHETMKASFEKDKPLFEKMHDLRKQEHAVLAADKFDAKAFESLNANIEKTKDKIREDRTRAFASIAPQFTPEEREAIVRWQAHRHGHHHGDHKGQPMAWKHGPDDQNRDDQNRDGQNWPNRGQNVTAPAQDNSAVSTTPNVNNNDYPPYTNR